MGGNVITLSLPSKSLADAGLVCRSEKYHAQRVKIATPHARRFGRRRPVPRRAAVVRVLVQSARYDGRCFGDLPERRRGKPKQLNIIRLRKAYQEFEFTSLRHVSLNCREILLRCP
jgi:hypothetical protein